MISVKCELKNVLRVTYDDRHALTRTELKDG
jgi:hypothetical protein